MIEPFYTSMINIQKLGALHAHQHTGLLVFLILALLVLESWTHIFSVEDSNRRQYIIFKELQLIYVRDKIIFSLRY